MFVITTKVSKTKIAALVTLLIAAVVLAAVLGAAKGRIREQPEVKNGADNDSRVAWLARQGWEVNAEPVQTQSVKIPAADSQVFTRYNELQKSQGFDLSQYAGRQAARYVYEVLNFPDAKGPVYATLFVLEDQIIGGDLTDSSPEGKMQGIVKAQSKEKKKKNEEQSPTN